MEIINFSEKNVNNRIDLFFTEVKNFDRVLILFDNIFTGFYMLSFIKGQIVSKDDCLVVIESNGMGYEVIMPASSMEKLPDVNEEVKIFVRLIPKEEELFLVGFISEDEKKIFDLFRS